MSRIFAAIVSLIAAGAAMWVQSLARDMWQIRSLPERVMEWSLLFIPLDLFERGIQQFGPDAKELALVGNVLGMAISLALIGYVLLRTALLGRRDSRRFRGALAYGHARGHADHRWGSLWHGSLSVASAG